jgi:hypothetical protein
MTTETAVKVIVIVVFLLYAYFMIGGYTPCNTSIDQRISTVGHRLSTVDHFKNCGCHDYHNYHNYVNDNYSNLQSKSSFLPEKNIYQNGPYLNV